MADMEITRKRTGWGKVRLYALYGISRSTMHRYLPEPSYKEKGDAGKEYAEKPEYVHHHWHVDIAYVKVCGEFFYFIALLDGYSRYVVGYPVHLNPNVREPVNRILKGIENIYLLEPLDYPYLIWLLSKSYLVLTDSGGIQEEAPSLGKPVLVMREVTERTEGIEAGTALLVGTDKKNIVESVSQLIDDKDKYEKMSKSVNPYGDGKTSKRIAKKMKEIFAS